MLPFCYLFKNNKPSIHKGLRAMLPLLPFFCQKLYRFQYIQVVSIYITITLFVIYIRGKVYIFCINKRDNIHIYQFYNSLEAFFR